MGKFKCSLCGIVIACLEGLVFVFAAAFLSHVFLHTALATCIVSFINKASLYQPAHAIMYMNGGPGGGRHVQNGKYSY